MNNRSPGRAVIAAFVLAALTACGGGDGSVSITPMVTTVDTAVTQPAPPSASAEEESEAAAFARLAPADKVLEDSNIYDTTKGGSIALKAVSEDSSVKRHTIVVNGESVPYTARAGHLVAYGTESNAVAGSALADGVATSTRKPQAAIFYTSYTRDGLPKENRPITFLWNGGPGSASIWLHMGSWGPKRLKSDAPNMPDRTVQPTSFPFVDNDISLLNQTDIVFVDPPGTGYSTAIAPFTNGDLWGTDIDAQVVADFITAYINKYSRQSSPKYLYGESYGGIRTPIVANLLEQAGTSHYASDPSGKPAKVLTGFILNSPLINYNSNCNMTGVFKPSVGTVLPEGTSCAGYIPSYAMVADYFGKSKKRGAKTQEQYLEELRKYAKTTYSTILRTSAAFDQKTLKPNANYPIWARSDEGRKALGELTDYIGLDLTAEGKIFERGAWYGFDNYWENIHANLLPSKVQFYFLKDPNQVLGRYDARMYVPLTNNFAADSYIDVAFLNQAKSYFPDFVNYKTSSVYQPLNNEPLLNGADFSPNWKFHRDGTNFYLPQSITDLQAVLTANPESKIMILHGYEDIATPGFQTELDLEGASLQDRIPVKWFEGGHMTYNTESSRAPLSKVINDFYLNPARDSAGTHVQSYYNLSAHQ